MLPFKARMQIVEECKEEFVVDSMTCKSYKAEVAGMNMTVYIPRTYPVKAGQCLESSLVFVTSHKSSKFKGDLALFVKGTNELDKESYVPMSNLEVYVNGKFVKTDKARIKKVGTDKNKRFLATTLIIRDDAHELLPILLVSFNNKAKGLFKLESNTFIDVIGRLYEKEGKDGFELNLTKFSTTLYQMKGDK